MINVGKRLFQGLWNLAGAALWILPMSAATFATGKVTASLTGEWLVFEFV